MPYILLLLGYALFLTPCAMAADTVPFTVANYDGTAVLTSSKLNLIFEGISLEETQVTGIFGPQPDGATPFNMCGGAGCSQAFYLQAANARKSITQREVYGKPGAGFAYVPESQTMTLWIGGQLVKIQGDQLILPKQTLKIPDHGSLTLVLKQNAEPKKVDSVEAYLGPNKIELANKEYVACGAVFGARLPYGRTQTSLNETHQALENWSRNSFWDRKVDGEALRKACLPLKKRFPALEAFFQKVQDQQTITKFFSETIFKTPLTHDQWKKLRAFFMVFAKNGFSSFTAKGDDLLIWASEEHGSRGSETIDTHYFRLFTDNFAGEEKLPAHCLRKWDPKNWTKELEPKSQGCNLVLDYSPEGKKPKKLHLGYSNGHVKVTKEEVEDPKTGKSEFGGISGVRVFSSLDSIPGAATPLQSKLWSGFSVDPAVVRELAMRISEFELQSVYGLTSLLRAKEVHDRLSLASKAIKGLLPEMDSYLANLTEVAANRLKTLIETEDKVMNSISIKISEIPQKPLRCDRFEVGLEVQNKSDRAIQVGSANSDYWTAPKPFAIPYWARSYMVLSVGNKEDYVPWGDPPGRNTVSAGETYRGKMKVTTSERYGQKIPLYLELLPNAVVDRDISAEHFSISRPIRSNTLLVNLPMNPNCPAVGRTRALK